MHGLTLANTSRNLLEKAEPAASAFLDANPSKRRRNFHPSNSSRAFTFHLFFRYISGGTESACDLLRALGQEGILAKWERVAVPNGTPPISLGLALVTNSDKW